jgi:hypothetical protein
MIAAVSACLPELPAARQRASRPPQTGWAFHRMPMLNRKTRQAIGKAKAGWTFATICTELDYACHKKKASWEHQRLSIGLRQLAEETGQSIGKVRRDVLALEGLGIVATVRTPMVIERNSTGKLIAKSKAGRVENTIVVLTICQEHLRPAKAERCQAGTEDGATLAPSPASVRPTLAPQSEKNKEIQRGPDGLADGIGSPPAQQAGRLAAAEEGRQSPAKASLENQGIVPANAGRDAPPAVPGRIVARPQPAPVARPSTPIKPGRRTNPHQADYAPAQGFTGRDLDAFQRTRQLLDAREQERRRQDEELRQRQQGAA